MTHLLVPHTVWLARLLSHLGSAGSWQYTGTKRDLRLDFLRGFAVCAMVIDHIGGEDSWFYLITGGNNFFVSVAEAFVFISGLLMGQIYASIIARQGLAVALHKCLQRAWKLYLLTTILTLSFASLTGAWHLWAAPDFSITPWPEFILSVFTVQRTFYMTDIILLYTLLVLAAAPVLYCLAHGYTRSVLTVSWGLWLLWQYAPQYAQVPWPILDNHVFNFAAWQALFMTALVIGYYRPQLTRSLARLAPTHVLMASGTLVSGILMLYAHAPLFPEPAALFNAFFGKPDLRLGRLLAFACFFSFAFALLTVAWEPCYRALRWLLLPLGQHALTAYTLHLGVLALIEKTGAWILGTAPTTAWHHTVLQGLGVSAVWIAITLQPYIVTQYRAWLGTVQALRTARGPEETPWEHPCKPAAVSSNASAARFGLGLPLPKIKAVALRHPVQAAAVDT